jgi:hypothetical protein
MEILCFDKFILCNRTGSLESHFVISSKCERLKLHDNPKVSMLITQRMNCTNDETIWHERQLRPIFRMTRMLRCRFLLARENSGNSQCLDG